MDNVRRELYMAKIRPFIDTDLIKIMTGIRRCGKSVMLELIKDELLERGVCAERFITLNFEDMDNAALCDSDALHEYVKEKLAGRTDKAYLFLDEVQEVLAWEKCVNSLRVKFDIDIYVTGSNANLLSKEFATYLGGRYAEFVIYPFSYLEFLSAGAAEQSAAGDGGRHDADAFRRYIAFGGMPFLPKLRYDADACKLYLKDLYSSVVLKDVMKRNNIRNVDLLERIIRYVVANVGRTFSATSISNYLKSEKRTVSPETVLNYLKACEDAYLFYRVKRNDLQGKRILAVGEKYYIADHGLRGAIVGENETDIQLVLENIVFLELLRRGYDVTVGKYGDMEADFVAGRDKEKLYIQVAYLLASESTIEREFRVLTSVKDNYPKYVLSLDEFDMSRDGVTHMNIRDFLTSSY
jgi:predicted AAA+ superfamily ATPase